MPKPTTAMFALFAALLACSLWQFFAIEQANQRNLQLSAEKAALAGNLSSCQSTAAELSGRIAEMQSKIDSLESTVASKNAQVSSLSESVNTLSEEVSALQTQNSRLSTGVEQAKAQLDDFERRVNESNSWFKANSNVQNVSQYRQMLFFFEFSCADITGADCLIKLACPRLVHDKFKEFSYQSDEDLFSKADKLQSLAEFFDNKGGDCEDYALLVKAEINYMRNYCASHGKPNVVFEAAAQSANEEDIYRVDVPKTWMYRGANAYSLPKTFTYVAEVCGTFASAYDPNDLARTQLFGHCVLGFSDRPVSSSADVPSVLSGLILIEPQTGFFVANLSQGGMYIPKSGEMFSNKSIYDQPSLWVVVTDDDYYLFSGNSSGIGKWSGYKDAYDEALTLRNSIETLE